MACNSASRTAYVKYLCRQSFSCKRSAASAAPSVVCKPSAAAAHTDFAGRVVDLTPLASAGKETPGPKSHHAFADAATAGGGLGGAVGGVETGGSVAAVTSASPDSVSATSVGGGAMSALV